MEMRAHYTGESVIRGHHVSKAHFVPVIERILPCAMKERIYTTSMVGSILRTGLNRPAILRTSNFWLLIQI